MDIKTNKTLINQEKFLLKFFNSKKEYTSQTILARAKTAY